MSEPVELRELRVREGTPGAAWSGGGYKYREPSVDEWIRYGIASGWAKPVVIMGGLTPAAYAAQEGDEPDGWLVVSDE